MSDCAKMGCNTLGAAGAIILPNVGAFLSSWPVKNNMAWYDGLQKPHCRPPNWAFAPVWTSLYTSMGYASYLVWRHGGGFHGPARIPLMVYGGHLLLNYTWTPIFFGCHKLKLSLCNVLALDVAAATTAYLFYHIRPLAGWLFAPYLAWLGMATYLTYSIAANNPDEGGFCCPRGGKAKITEIKDE